MRRLPSNQFNYPVHRERDTRALKRLALLLVCGLFLAGGFVYAAGQHFAAVQYGYKSEELRRQHALLVEEQRRLMLEREQANAPEHLGEAARRYGLQPVQSSQISSAKSSGRTQLPTSPAFISPSASLSR